MSRLDEALAPYDYAFPKSLIAQAPASPADSARLLVYDRATGDTTEDIFANLAKYLPPRSVVVFNQTKVIPARLVVKKETGGKAVLLYVRTEGKRVLVMADRRLTIGSMITLGPDAIFTVIGQRERFFVLKPRFPFTKLSATLAKYGDAPLPPYISQSPLTASQRKRQYQTVFAKTPGAVAAPTASLHFTKRLLAKLRRAGHDTAFVALHVGLGTFAPLTEEQLAAGRLHEEHYEIDAKTATLLNRAKKEGRPIIAVGTTVMRTLESACDSRAKVRPGSRTTALFIKDGYHFRMVNSLITNFHVPKSSLLMLVAAFAGRDAVMRLYRRAIRKRFRLFSFGDGMLIR